MKISFFVLLVSTFFTQPLANAVDYEPIQCNCGIFYTTAYGTRGGGSGGGFERTAYLSQYSTNGYYGNSEFGALDEFEYVNASYDTKGVIFKILLGIRDKNLINEAQKLATRVLAKPKANRLHQHNRASTLRKRGWTDKEIEDLLKDPERLSFSKDSITFWANKRDHIVVTKGSGVVLQISNKNGRCFLDHRISYPYGPDNTYPTYNFPTPPSGGVPFANYQIDFSNIGSVF